MSAKETTTLPGTSWLAGLWERLKSWEGLLLVMLLAIFAINSTLAPGYLTVGNQINLFILSIEKVIIALTMTLLIINGEIDLSVSSIMALAACIAAGLYRAGAPFGLALVAALAGGLLAGAFNGFWIARVGLNSLVVTLATQIAYRGLARAIVEDASIGRFPEWFNRLGQQKLVGPLPLALLIFFALFVLALIVLQYSGFGRRVYVIGNSKEVARFSGVKVPRAKFMLYLASGLISALAGLLIAARLGAIRGDLATGYELDIITMALLGGVSIFGGSGTLYGVFLSILIILNVRNGMGLASLSGHFQTGVIGILLILSVLGPNLINQTRATLQRRRMRAAMQRTSSSNAL